MIKLNHQIFIWSFLAKIKYSKTAVKRLLPKRPQIGFQDQLSLNAGQKYCRMPQWEHSAILSTFIRLPFTINFLFLSGRFTQVLRQYQLELVISLEHVYCKVRHRVYTTFFMLNSSGHEIYPAFNVKIPKLLTF